MKLKSLFSVIITIITVLSQQAHADVTNWAKDKWERLSSYDWWDDPSYSYWRHIGGWEKEDWIKYNYEQAKKDPVLAAEYASDWARRGRKDVALKFAVIYGREVLSKQNRTSVFTWFYPNPNDVTKAWYDNGQVDLARAADRAFAVQKTKAASMLADKWRKRHEFGIALDFDLFYVAKNPLDAQRTSDKLYKLGQKDTRDMALDLDRFYVRYIEEGLQDKALGEKSFANKEEQANLIEKIADKWYARKEVAIALQFDQWALMIRSTQLAPITLQNLAVKWFLRDQKAIAMAFTVKLSEKYPHLAESVADEWSTLADEPYPRAVFEQMARNETAIKDGTLGQEGEKLVEVPAIKITH